MRIGIIGLINHDTIFMAGGRQIQDLGGILYNTTVMADLVGDNDRVYPISRIGADCYDAMRRILASRPGVETTGVALAAEGTSRNHIRYDEDMEKVEQLTNRVGPIPFEQIEPFLDLDALLVNFIVGDDIALETMEAIRSSASGLLYLDVHNLCLGIDAEGYRRRRAPEDWRRWIEMFDVVQMNEVEARLLAGRKLEEAGEFIAFGKSILPLGPSVVIATRGDLGSVTVYREDNEAGAIVTPPEALAEMVDTTGCGDAFAAGFLVGYLRGRDPAGATRLATRVATLNCTMAGMPEAGRFLTS